MLRRILLRSLWAVIFFVCAVVAVAYLASMLESSSRSSFAGTVFFALIMADALSLFVFVIIGPAWVFAPLATRSTPPRGREPQLHGVARPPVAPGADRSDAAGPRGHDADQDPPALAA